jgi:hypothetical protein
MAFLGSVSSIVELIKSLGLANEECNPTKPDDCGEGDSYRAPGEALAKFDFSQGVFGSHDPDHSGDMVAADMEAALASMSSSDALEYAIAQMGPADHFDAGNFDVPADTSHDTGT